MGDNPFHLPIYFSEIEPLLQQVETGHHHHTIPGLEELVLCNDSSIVYSNRTVNDHNLQKLMGWEQENGFLAAHIYSKF